MSDHERGAYTPPTDAPLSFDPRQPVRGSRPLPFTLIISVLVLLGVAAAIFLFYRSGVRQAGQPPQAVGAPVSAMKAPPPAEAQPQDPAAGLQIYKTEGGKAAPASTPQFTPPPEQPQARPEPAQPKVVVTQAPLAAPASAASAPTLRPAIPAQPPAAAPKAAPPVAKAPLPAPKVEKAAPPPAAKAAPAKPEVKAEAKPAKPEAKAAPEPASKASGVAAVQIGAFSSQALADKGWNDAAGIAPGAAAGKGKSVEKVDVNGKTLFRTQVTGFKSRADATAFCDKLKAAGKACFVK